jgi:hypothetical protein
VWFSLAGVAWSRGKQKRRVAGSLWKQRGEKIEEAGVGMGEPRGEEQEGGGSGRHEGRRGLAGAPTQARQTWAARHAGTGEGKGTDKWAGATVPRFESIQTDQVIQTLFEFKF